MLGALYPGTQRNIPEDLNLQQHHCENLKSCKDSIVAMVAGLIYIVYVFIKAV
jgi:hypothetical protein